MLVCKLSAVQQNQCPVEIYIKLKLIYKKNFHVQLFFIDKVIIFTDNKILLNEQRKLKESNEMKRK